MIPREKQTSRRWRKLVLNNGGKGHSFVTEASSTSSMQNKPRFLSMKPRHHTNAFSSTAATGSEKAKDVVDINRADLWMRQACSSTVVLRCWRNVVLPEPALPTTTKPLQKTASFPPTAMPREKWMALVSCCACAEKRRRWEVSCEEEVVKRMEVASVMTALGAERRTGRAWR